MNHRSHGRASRDVADAVRRHRAHIASLLGALGVVLPLACSTGGSRSGSGLLVAPMQSAPETLAAATDGGTDGARVYRPFPSEARSRSNASCDRSVDCVAELDEAPDWPYAPPFSKCAVIGDHGGVFHQQESRNARHDTPDACCYVSFDCEDRGKRVIRAVPGRALEGGPALEGTGRAAMVEGELFSIFAFRALARDLAALGAPAALVAEAWNAADDEAAHVVAASRLAALAHERVVVDDRGASLPRPATLAEIVRASLLDGCVGEATVAMSLSLAASRADGEEACILHSVADDEARHAALGWRTLAWALEHDPACARPALAAALDTLLAREPAIDATFLDEEEARTLAVALTRDAIVPLAQALLAAA